MSPRIGLLYPTRDCGEADFADLCRRIDPAAGVGFAYVTWSADVGRLDDLDAEQAEAVTADLGVPASSTSLAYLAALDRLGIRRVALASVYDPGLTSVFADFLAAAGCTTVHAVSASAPSDRALAAWDAARITELAVSADHEDAEAVLVPETALHTTPLLAELESRLGKPVLTATAVTLWHAFRQAGADPVRGGLGRLFAGR
jgi:maleate cis-trans isomerase